MLALISLLAQSGPSKSLLDPEFLPQESLLARAIVQMPQNRTVLLSVVVGGWFLLLGLLLLLLLTTRYRVSPRHLTVTVLGIPVRWIRLDDIRYMSTEPVRFAERWHNQLFPKPQTMLVIHRRHGWVRKLVLTPHQRFALMAEISRARDALVASEGVMTGHTAPNRT